MQIALISLDSVWEDKDASFARAESAVKAAADAGAELAILPEMTLTGFSMNTPLIAEDENASPTAERFCALAAEAGVHILFGMVHRAGASAVNSLMCASPEGVITSRYDKIHPFSFAGEDRHYTGGSRLAWAEVNGRRFGLAVCYDLRFPELYSALAASADAVVTIASWPEKRVEHWRTLGAARAIEQQTIHIMVNRTGTDGAGLSYTPSSTVFMPDGLHLFPVSTPREDVHIYSVDFSAADAFRSRFSTRADRKNALYRSFLP